MMSLSLKLPDNGVNEKGSGEKERFRTKLLRGRRDPDTEAFIRGFSTAKHITDNLGSSYH